MTKHEKLDLILHFLVKNQQERFGFDSLDIKEQVLPEESLEEIDFLFGILKHDNAAWVNIVNDPKSIRYDPSTVAFLADGGYVERQEKYILNEKHQRDQATTARWQKYMFWVVTLFAFVSFADTILRWVKGSSPEEIETIQTEPEWHKELHISKEDTTVTISSSISVDSATSSKN